MFPTIATSADYEQPLREQIISTSTELSKTPLLNFEDKSVVLSNGSPKMVSNIEAIRQWITLFVITPKDTYEIYKGTGFGTSIRKLFGRKILNNGYEEAEASALHAGQTFVPEAAAAVAPAFASSVSVCIFCSICAVIDAAIAAGSAE